MCSSQTFLGFAPPLSGRELFSETFCGKSCQICAVVVKMLILTIECSLTTAQIFDYCTLLCSIQLSLAHTLRSNIPCICNYAWERPTGPSVMDVVITTIPIFNILRKAMGQIATTLLWNFTGAWPARLKGRVNSKVKEHHPRCISGIEGDTAPRKEALDVVSEIFRQKCT